MENFFILSNNAPFRFLVIFPDKEEEYKFNELEAFLNSKLKLEDALIVLTYIASKRNIFLEIDNRKIVNFKEVNLENRKLKQSTNKYKISFDMIKNLLQIQDSTINSILFKFK